jgi:hypothetical protein
MEGQLLNLSQSIERLRAHASTLYLIPKAACVHPSDAQAVIPYWDKIPSIVLSGLPVSAREWLQRGEVQVLACRPDGSQPVQLSYRYDAQQPIDPPFVMIRMDQLIKLVENMAGPEDPYNLFGEQPDGDPAE